MTPFVWGENDCVLGLARRTIIALTGVDLASTVEGTYSTEIGAKRLLTRLGYSGLGELLEERLPLTNVDLADVGDLALIETPDGLGHAVAVFDTYGLVIMTPEGPGRLPREAALKAYSVG